MLQIVEHTNWKFEALHKLQLHRNYNSTMGDAQDCKAFFYSEDRPEPEEVYPNIQATELFDLLVPAEDLIEDITPAKQQQRQDLEDIVEGFMGRACTWDHGRTYQDNAITILHCWLFITTTCKSVHTNFLRHETLGDTNQKQLERSLNNARMGLVPFMIASVIHGAGRKTYLKKSLAEQDMSQMERFAFALPLLQCIKFDGDAHDCLSDFTWRFMYEGHDVHCWLKHIQELAHKNIWSEAKILPATH